MSFTESNTVERMILEALLSRSAGSRGPLVLRELPPSWGGSLGGDMAGAAAHWEYVPATDIPRQAGDVMVEASLRLALVRPFHVVHVAMSFLCFSSPSLCNTCKL